MLLSVESFSTISVQVFSKDEGLGETNISKPRIYIRNNGTEAISGFIIFYYLTTESEKQPILDDYYTPGSTETIESLGSSLYRIKYDFSGITLQPGNIFPDASGNIVGLHYSDWSTFDKTNDFSNNLSSSFSENLKIPVYLNGIKIYGSEPSTPPVPPVQPIPLPEYAFPLSHFAVFGLDECNVRDRVRVTDGSIGSNTIIETGCQSIIDGDAISSGTLFLRDGAQVYGNAFAGSAIFKQNNVIINGSEIDSVTIKKISLSTHSVLFGGTDFIVPNDSITTVPPGSYNSIHIYSRATVTFNVGTYYCRELLVEPDVSINFGNSAGEFIAFEIQDQMRIGDRCIMSFMGDKYPFSIQFYSNQTSNLSIGTDVVFMGLLVAPAGSITVYSRTAVEGALYGKSVRIEPDVTICKPPVLSGLSISTGAYTPLFDSYKMTYTAVVPDATNTIICTPDCTEPGVSILINGRSPQEPVSLPTSSTDCIIDLTGGKCSGKTSYKLTVQKSSTYRIFVNDDSPSPENECDGTSWQKAYKNLQYAIDDAIQSGKEIWIAEGIYRPSIRTDSTDGRSATFILGSGLELKGGFNGQETDTVPLGSPYKTIISGDLANNDSLLTEWPPVSSADSGIISDNSYHVITVEGIESISGLSISGVCIQHGNADAQGIQSAGAGIFCSGKLPSLERCIIRRNRAIGNGAGVYTLLAPDSLFNCLFQDNISVQGNGGGIYFTSSNRNTRILASVFHNNRAIGAGNSSSGGGICWNYANGDIINSVFYGNFCSKDGGGLFLRNSTVGIINCTFVRNSAQQNGGGIKSDSSHNSVIFNTILWENISASENELSGPFNIVNHCCISGGYAGGENIITANPVFLNINDPMGGNDKFGDLSDGLNLTMATSPCVNAGKDSSNIPETDIILTARTSPDIGAYEAFSISDESEKTFGYIDPSGQFVPDEPIKAIDTIRHWWYINIYAASNLGYTAKVYVPNNKYTKGKHSIYSLLYSLNDDGSIRADLPPVRIDLYKVGETNDKLIFQTQTADKRGKPIVFVMEKTYHNWNNNWAYVVSSTNGYFLAITPSSQF